MLRHLLRTTNCLPVAIHNERMPIASVRRRAERRDFELWDVRKQDSG